MEMITRYFTDFTEKQLQQIGALKDLYQEWNNKINVISRKDIDFFYEHHVLHSLAIATQFEFPDNHRIMDLGTGGGFPGIPLAILFPDAHFHLVDSINKKLKVAEEVISALELSNVTVQHTRVEDLKDKKFDVVVSRAVAPLKDLWYWSKPLLKQQTTNNKQQSNIPRGLICLKGGNLATEIAESRCKPFVWEIEKIFEESYFKHKYLLYVKY